MNLHVANVMDIIRKWVLSLVYICILLFPVSLTGGHKQVYQVCTESVCSKSGSDPNWASSLASKLKWYIFFAYIYAFGCIPFQWSDDFVSH